METFPIFSPGQPSSGRCATRLRTCREIWRRRKSSTMRKDWTGCWRRIGGWSWGVRSWKSSWNPGMWKRQLKVKLNMGESWNPGMVTAQGSRRRWPKTPSTSRASGPSLTSCELTLGDSRRPLTLWRTHRWVKTQEPSKPKQHHHRQERVRSEYEETLMKQRALFDEEIVTLTEEMRDEAKAGFRFQSPWHPDHYITSLIIVTLTEEMRDEAKVGFTL